MFRTDAFGQRINCMPRIRFAKEQEGGGGGGSEPPKVTLDGEEFDFPAATAVADMTPDQKAEYWRHQSKKQQAKGAQPPADYVELQNKAKELEKLKKDGLDDHQRAIEEAKEAARREGENIGSEKYLRDAVIARFQLLTGKDDDTEVASIFAHVDAKSFTDDKGEILADKLKEFAATFGTKAAAGSPDAVAAALARQRAAGGGSGSSIADKRKETRESLTKTKA